MESIIAVSGRGSSLFPLSNIISKHQPPIYNNPWIYYLITTLIVAGVTDIWILINRNEINSYENLLGNGSNYGCNFEFCEQDKPIGIRDVLNYSNFF